MDQGEMGGERNGRQAKFYTLTAAGRGQLERKRPAGTGFRRRSI
jgi:DNA-binding PadR family transcriptional regulator